MLKALTSALLVTISLSHANAGISSQETGKCEKRVIHAVSSEDAPAAIEACFDAQMVRDVNSCKITDVACIRTASGMED